MRPKKDVLMWGPVEEHVQHAAYVAGLKLPVRVHTVATMAELLAAANEAFFAVALIHPSERQLDQVQTRVFIPLVVCERTTAMMTLLERLKIAISRKRGPKALPAADALRAEAKKPPASVDVSAEERAA